MTAIASVEQLRGGLAGLPGVTLAVSLTRPGEDIDANREAAAAAFGLQAEIEPDTPGAEVGTTACSWCGRTDPEGGLTESYPRPAPPPPAIDIDTGRPMPAVAPEPAQVDNSGDAHCANETDCQASREAAEPLWFDSQHHGWRISWDKYREVLAYQAAQAARSRWGGGIYQLSREPVEDELSQLELAALAEVRLAVENNLTARIEAGQLRLAAEQPAAPVPAPVRLFDPWAHTMRHPANRVHTLGHHRQHPHVTDAASALGRKAARARST
jgi:hypothetical protein